MKAEKGKSVGICVPRITYDKFTDIKRGYPQGDSPSVKKRTEEITKVKDVINKGYMNDIADIERRALRVGKSTPLLFEAARIIGEFDEKICLEIDLDLLTSKRPEIIINGLKQALEQDMQYVENLHKIHFSKGKSKDGETIFTYKRIAGSENHKLLKDAIRFGTKIGL